MNYEVDKRANEILNISRNKLLVNLRFMDVALSYHKRIAYEGMIATDRKRLLYNPRFVLRTYKESQDEMVRVYMHMILHCVFQQPLKEMIIPHDITGWQRLHFKVQTVLRRTMGIKRQIQSKEEKFKIYILKRLLDTVGLKDAQE